MTQKTELQLFDEFVAKQRELLFSKGHDYAQDGDVLSNFKLAGGAIGKRGIDNALALIATKIVRLGNLFSRKTPPKNESVEDTFVDLANYTFLAYCLEREPNTPEVLQLKEPMGNTTTWVASDFNTNEGDQTERVLTLSKNQKQE